MALIILAGLVTACGDSPAPPPTPTPENSENKVDSILLDLLIQYRVNGNTGALKYAREKGLLDPQDNVLFTLVLDDNRSVPAVSEQLKKMGGTVRGTYQNYIAAGVPLSTLVSYATQDEKRESFLRELSNFSSVREIRLAPPPATGS